MQVFILRTELNGHAWNGHGAQPGCSVTGGPAEIAAVWAAEACSCCWS